MEGYPWSGGWLFVLGVGLSLDAFAVCAVALCRAVSVGTALRINREFWFFPRGYASVGVVFNGSVRRNVGVG